MWVPLWSVTAPVDIKMILKRIVTLSQTGVPRSRMLCCVSGPRSLAELLQKNKVRRGAGRGGQAAGRGQRPVSHSDPRPAQLVTATGPEWTSQAALSHVTLKCWTVATSISTNMNLSADSTISEDRQNLSLVLLQQMYGQPLSGENPRHDPLWPPPLSKRICLHLIDSFSPILSPDWALSEEIKYFQCELIHISD